MRKSISNADKEVTVACNRVIIYNSDPPSPAPLRPLNRRVTRSTVPSGRIETRRESSNSERVGPRGRLITSRCVLMHPRPSQSHFEKGNRGARARARAHRTNGSAPTLCKHTRCTYAAKTSNQGRAPTDSLPLRKTNSYFAK